MKTTVDDCRIIELGKHHGATGNITVVENGKVIDFDIKRVFYIYDIPGGVTRGAHAHKTLRELIVAATGSFEVRVFDGEREKVFLLNHPSKALYLPCGIFNLVSVLCTSSPLSSIDIQLIEDVLLASGDAFEMFIVISPSSV